MSVVYEPRSFMHDGSYPPIGDPDHDHADDPRVQFPSPDVSDLGPYSLPASMSADDRSMMSDALASEAVMVSDAQLNMTSASALASLPSNLPDTLPSNDKEDSDAATTSARSKCIPKPDRDVQKQADGKFYCTFPGCTEDTQVFGRKCEWR